MKEEYREAFSEVSEIIKLMPTELANCIPIEFRDILESEKSKEYFPSIREPLEEVHLKRESIILLGMIYRDFLCSKEERQHLKETEEQQMQELQEEMENLSKEKMNYSKKLSEINGYPSQENVSGVRDSGLETRLTVRGKKWYQKIVDLVKHLF